MRYFSLQEWKWSEADEVVTEKDVRYIEGDPHCEWILTVNGYSL